MPPKESKASATTRRQSEDTAIIDVRLRVILVRPTGARFERLMDLARKRPEFFWEYAHGELTSDITLAYLKGADDARVPIDEHFWRTLRATHPEVLIHLVRALGDALMG